MDTPSFVDGIGRRVWTIDSTGQEVETLRLCRELSEASSTEAALVERAGRLAGFVHPGFSQVLRVERVRGALGGLSIVSGAIPGVRLSDVLAQAQRKWLAPDPGASLYLLEQVASSLAAFHRHSHELSHGALGPERVVIRPDGHPVIVEHLLSPALEALQLGRGLLWAQFRVPVPAVAGAARFDQMTDIMQLGMLALAIVLGRPIAREEYPQKLQDLLGEATTPGALGNRPVVSRALYGWMRRTLQFESRPAFRSAAEASAALDAIVAEQAPQRVSPAAVVAYVAASMAPGDGRAAAAPPVPPASSVPAPEQAGTTEPPAVAATEPPSSVTTRVVRRNREAAREAVGREVAGVARRAAGTQRRWSIAARLSGLDWTSFRRAARVSLVALGLAGLFGVTYLGARGYLGFPDFLAGKGTLIVESTPSGAELFVDGRRSGQTPATLELSAGEHTLALTAGRGTTFVPVVVVSGARRVERVEIRQPRRQRQ